VVRPANTRPHVGARSFLIEIPIVLAFLSIVSTDVLNFAAICDSVAPWAAIEISLRSSL
jgi:hypothetical protein